MKNVVFNTQEQIQQNLKNLFIKIEISWWKFIWISAFIERIPSAELID